MPYIELVQDKNTINKFPSHFKVYADMNPYLLSQHNHQMILEKLKQEKIFIMMNMWKMKIITMYKVVIPMMMIINNSYFIFNIL